MRNYYFFLFIVTLKSILALELTKEICKDGKIFNTDDTYIINMHGEAIEPLSCTIEAKTGFEILANYVKVHYESDSHVNHPEILINYYSSDNAQISRFHTRLRSLNLVPAINEKTGFVKAVISTKTGLKELYKVTPNITIVFSVITRDNCKPEYKFCNACFVHEQLCDTIPNCKNSTESESSVCKGFKLNIYMIIGISIFAVCVLIIIVVIIIFKCRPSKNKNMNSETEKSKEPMMDSKDNEETRA